MQIREFPLDMQHLLAELVDESNSVVLSTNDFLDWNVPVRMVPLNLFPKKIQAQLKEDDRAFEDYLDTEIEEFPPVLVAHGYWIDGRHRVWSARAREVKAILTADISRLVSLTYVKRSKFLGRMRKISS